MGTSVNIPDTSVAMAVKTDLVTFMVVKEVATTTAADGTSTSKVTLRHTSSEKEMAKLKADSPDKIVGEQSVTAYSVGTVEGLTELVPDVDEQIAIINRGLGAKFNQKIKTVLTEADEAGNPTFQFVEGAYDSKELLQQGTQRRNLSETDKAIKALSGLDPETLAKVMAQFAALQNATA